MHAMGEKVIAMIAPPSQPDRPHPDRRLPGAGEPVGARSTTTSLFDIIDRLGHRGWVGCEYVPAAETEAGLSWMARHKC